MELILDLELEIFTVGHNIVDLESTALYNLREIIEFEANNSYSQNRSFYFIYNLPLEKVRDIVDISDIRCVLNTNENASSLAKSIKNQSFVFYNKKSIIFLNYNKSNVDLEFENYLISSSEDITVLHEKIQKIKIVATRIFKEINHSSNLGNIS